MCSSANDLAIGNLARGQNRMPKVQQRTLDVGIPMVRGKSDGISGQLGVLPRRDLDDCAIVKNQEKP